MPPIGCYGLFRAYALPLLVGGICWPIALLLAGEQGDWAPAPVGFPIVFAVFGATLVPLHIAAMSIVRARKWPIAFWHILLWIVAVAATLLNKRFGEWDELLLGAAFGLFMGWWSWALIAGNQINEPLTDDRGPTRRDTHE